MGPACGPQQRSRRHVPALALTIVALFGVPQFSSAYSVLGHETTVDSMWDSEIVPLLRSRFGPLTEIQLAKARAYAYGGSLIQDLGYYPFGSHLFTNLTHYVRTGDFVESLLRGAVDANDYAFALGALAHYASDNAGHPLAVNRGVPIMYPKVGAEVGPTALYVDAPARHVMLEFAFDVLRVAQGGYVAQAFRDRIGFEVAKEALERAVLETYNVKLSDLLLSVDLAIGTYRRAVSTTIPELTRIAWRDKREEIERHSPSVTEAGFIFSYTAGDYERDYGTRYRKPGLLARILGFILKIVPKVGPFRPLAFEPLTPEVEQLFAQSADAAQARYGETLRALRSGSFRLPNTDFDTGQPPRLGTNRLADETYAALVHTLAEGDSVVPEALQRELAAFFSATLVSTPRHPATPVGRRTITELETLARRSARP